MIFRNQHALIMSTLTVVLTLSACGSKTDAYKPTTNPAGKASVTAAQTKSSPEAPKLISSAEDMPKAVKKDARKSTADLPASSRRGSEANKSSRDDQGDLIKQSPLFTGMSEAKTQLNFTGSSPDALLGFVKSELAKESSQVQKANLKAASSILDAKLNLDSFSGEAELKLKMASGSVVLRGAMGLEKSQRMMSSKKSVKGSIQCLDFNPGAKCVNALAKIKTENGSAVIILRNSIVDLHFDMDLSDRVNYSYSNLRQFFVNSIQQIETENRLDSRRLETFEVVNGRSGFSLTMMGFNKEFLGFSGALLAPSSGSAVNLPLVSLKSSSAESQNLLSSGKISLKFADSVVDAKVINNNGLGQLRLALKIADLGKDESNMMTVVASRRVKKINELSADLLK